jgi:hypothetical protein
MAQLRALSVQKGELLEMLLVLLPRCLPRLTLLCKLIFKGGNYSCKILGVSTCRGGYYGIL